MNKIKEAFFLISLIFLLTQNKVINLKDQTYDLAQKNSNYRSKFMGSSSLNVKQSKELQQDDVIEADGYQQEEGGVYYEEDDGESQQTPSSSTQELQNQYYGQNEQNNDYQQYQQQQQLPPMAAMSQDLQQQDYDQGEDFNDLNQEDFGGQFQNQQQKTYRLNVFQKNEQEIEAHNRDSKAKYKRGDTGFLFQDPKQFISGMLMILPKRPPQANIYIQADKNFTVQYVDWRKHMSEVVSQKRKCLSCYAFGVTFLIQAHYSIYGKTREIFSEQQIIDCCKQGCDGCKGGYPDAAISYFAEAGLDRGDNYPYVQKVSQCQFKKGPNTINIINSEQPHGMYRGGRNIKFALRRAPVSILLDVMSWDPLYKEGVFDRCPESDFNFNHVAVLSGLRKDDDAWIVRNSWGSQWGDNGYIYLPSGNPCGIQEEGIQPNLFNGTLFYDQQKYQRIINSQQSAQPQPEPQQQQQIGTETDTSDFFPSDLSEQQENQNYQYTDSGDFNDNIDANDDGNEQQYYEQTNQQQYDNSQDWQNDDNSDINYEQNDNTNTNKNQNTDSIKDTNTNSNTNSDRNSNRNTNTQRSQQIKMLGLAPPSPKNDFNLNSLRDKLILNQILNNIRNQNLRQKQVYQGYGQMVRNRQ